MTKADIGQLLSDQMCEFMGRKAPMIEAEPYDDELGNGFDPLSRWGDRVYRLQPHTWMD